MKKFQKIIALLLCLTLMGALLCACNGSGEAQQEVAVTDDLSEHKTIKWYMPKSQPKGFEEVMAEANKYLKEKLNITLDLQCVESSDYANKMQLALSAGEEFDLLWTSNWKFNYESNVNKGAFQALDEYLDLPELADLKNFYSEGIWGAATVGGKIYGVPMQQVLYNQKGVKFIKEYLDKYGFTDYYNQAKSYEDLEEIYDVVLAGEAGDPTFAITTSNQKDYFIPETTKVSGGDITGAIYIVDGEVTARFDEYEEHYRRMREWNLRGYFPEGIATAETDNITQFSGYTRYLPGVEGKQKLSTGKDVIVVPTTEAFLSRNGVQSTLTAVSSTSKNAVRALKLLYLTHTDEYLFNLLCYGIEGRDFIRDPENPKRMTRTDTGYYINEFQVGNQFLAYLVPSYEDGVWEETDKANKEAYVDPNIAFSFDSKAVESEISQVSSIATEYRKIFEFGLQDADTSISEYREKLELAGFDEIMSEIERQYEDWKATQE